MQQNQLLAESFSNMDLPQEKAEQTKPKVRCRKEITKITEKIEF